MDVYGLSTTDLFRIDDLLDFTNEDGLFSSDDATANSDLDLQHHHIPPPEYPCNNSHLSTSSSSPSAAVSDAPLPSSSTDFTDDFYVPNDDKAELEWLSKFVDDSFTDLPANELTGAITSRPDTSFPCRTRRKRSKAVTMTKIWTLSSEPETPTIGKSKTISINLNTKNNDTTYSAPTIAVGRPSSSSPPVGVRRCTHCASEKTPQWRTGPLGPKTLCNACGVRYKSGRLVPEYRPAASPTFVLTQHSNSHRKVMELRRQKETHVLQSDEQMQQRQVYHHHHDFQVC